MRLIDADSFIRFLAEQKVKETGAFTKGLNKALNVAISAQKNLQITPTVDAVPVVRCRDCALFEEIGTRPGNEGAPFGYCYHWDYEQGMSPNQVDGNDFCSYGEPKEG